MVSALCQVWAETFATRLAIRPVSQHASCSICIKHKIIIKRLGDDRAARDAQLKLYGQHLRKQYDDRAVYWQCRSLSRMRNVLPAGFFNLTLILDGVDHSKFRYPRSRILCSKEFSAMPRPAMDVHGILAHGHGAYLALSEPFTPKDSSWCAELLLHTLHRMVTVRGADLRLFEVCVQSDNTSRECKNNTLLRVLGVLTGLHKVKRAQLQCLMTAHSHEDIDAFFAHMLSYLESIAELHTPSACLQALREYLSRPTTRPDEPDKDAFLVHDVRDWFLVSSFQDVSFLPRKGFNYLAFIPIRSQSFIVKIFFI